MSIRQLKIDHATVKHLEAKVGVRVAQEEVRRANQNLIDALEYEKVALAHLQAVHREWGIVE